MTTHQHLFDRYHLKMANSIINDLHTFELGVNPHDENFDKPLKEVNYGSKNL